MPPFPVPLVSATRTYRFVPLLVTLSLRFPVSFPYATTLLPHSYSYPSPWFRYSFPLYLTYPSLLNTHRALSPSVTLELCVIASEVRHNRRHYSMSSTFHVPATSPSSNFQLIFNTALKAYERNKRRGPPRSSPRISASDVRLPWFDSCRAS